MSSARITIEVEGVKHSLYFGMLAVEMIAKKSVEAAAKGEADDLKSFAHIIHAGMCNHADMKDFDRPSFEEAYIIAESLASDEEQSKLISDAWINSKPHKELIERLSGIGKKKAVESPRKSSKKTGTN